MGVNFYQSVILGVEIKEEDCYVLISPAEYELQNRYDPKTGKVVGQENVLIKPEEYKYSFAGVDFEEFYDFEEAFKKVLNPKLSFICKGDGSSNYIGYMLGESEDYGNVDLVKGSISVSELVKMEHELQSLFNEYKLSVKLFFISDAG